MLKKLLTHSFLYSLAPQVPKIASLVLLPIITQHLTAEDYGIYGIITSYLFISSALKDLGFSVIFVNTFFKFPHRWKFIWRMLHGHLILWNLVFIIILFALLLIAVPQSAMHNFWWIALLTIVPVIVFDNTNLIGNYYFRFSQKPAYIAFSSGIAAVVSVAATYYCIVELQLGYMSWFITSFVSTFVMFLLFVYPVYGRLKLIPIIKWRRRFITPHLKVALPMIPHNYSSFLLNSSDRIVMDIYKIDIGKVGSYNIAYQFGSYFESVAEAIGMAVGPFYSKLYTSKRSNAEYDARALTFFLMGSFVLGAFLLSLWMKEIFYLLIRNDELKDAYGIGIIILMSYAARPMYFNSGIKLSLNEKTGVLWRITFVAGLINLALNLIFVPYYGINAAAVITFLSLLYMSFAGYFFKAYRQGDSAKFYPIAWIVLLFIFTTVAILLRDANFIIKTILSVGLLCASTYILLKNFKRLQAIDI
ncbi:MAG TPA: oligosaccharide flippase family protein [Chitinophagaceae bacterium]